MKNNYYLFLLTLFVFSCAENQKEQIDRLEINFVGDVNLARGVDTQTRLFGNSLIINSFLNLPKSDFTFINFKGTLTTAVQKETDQYNFKSIPIKAKVFEPPKHLSYVEPNIIFWNKALELVEWFESFHDFDNTFKEYLGKIKDLGLLFKSVAVKQLSGQKVIQKNLMNYIMWVLFL